MQLDTTLDLEKAKMARQHEAIYDESRGLTAGNTTVLESMSAGKYNNQRLEVNQRDKVDKRTCIRCGKKAHVYLCLTLFTPFLLCLPLFSYAY